MKSSCVVRVNFLMSSDDGSGAARDVGLSGVVDVADGVSAHCLSSHLLSVSVWNGLPVGVLK